jgi:hypothetical protein
MNSRSRVRHSIAVILIGVLVGGGLMAITPAGAEVSQMATNWTKIWKKKLQPQADKRYYTKSTSDSKYATKTESDAKYATKTESDAKYQPKGSYATAGSSYTRAESDAKYAAKPVVLRGDWVITGVPAGDIGTTSVGFGLTLPAAPTAHYIPAGAAPPQGCSGTYASPGASAGHLCVFEYTAVTANNRNVCRIGGTCPAADPWGFYVRFDSAAAGAYSWGTWALGVDPATNTAGKTAPAPGVAAGRTP